MEEEKENQPVNFGHLEKKDTGEENVEMEFDDGEGDQIDSKQINVAVKHSLG